MPNREGLATAKIQLVLQRPEGAALFLSFEANFFAFLQIDGAIGEQLLISQLNARQFGVYQCEAANSAGLDIAAVWVRQRAERSSDVEAPSILVPPLDATGRENGQAVFTCMGTYGSEIQWLKDGGQKVEDKGIESVNFSRTKVGLIVAKVCPIQSHFSGDQRTKTG